MLLLSEENLLSDEVRIRTSAFTSPSACATRGKARQLNLQHRSHCNLEAWRHPTWTPPASITDPGWTTNCKFDTV
jgi:hypothetical protein